MEVEMEMGIIYEVDHSQLPPRTPAPLKSIRLVMVSEKTDLNVSVRYPSFQSLESYFRNRFTEIYPLMDEKFVMGTKLAGKVLSRRISSDEFAQKKYLEEFWLVISQSSSTKLGSGSLLTQLKSNGIIQWGVRRQVKFIGRHRDIDANYNSPSSTKNVEGDGERVDGEEEDEKSEGKEEDTKSEKEEESEGEEEEEQEEEVKEEDEEEKEVETIETYERPKRKCCMVQSAKKAKKVKREEKKTIKAKKINNCKQIVLAKSPLSTRWSDDRYKQAQHYLLEVMKAKGAVCEKPILRPELREEARKKIGDTGLLDHLLKHMAGMVAPGGVERFRRRHNAEGAMEYWLESAELVDIRRKAGVQDPYWTPPPGWKVGDCPTQDPICAKELKELKEETSKLKRDMKGMVSKKKMEKELAKVRREMEKLLSKNQNKESQAMVVSDPCQKLNIVASPNPISSDSSFVQLEKYYKEQLATLSENFTRIEGEMVKLSSKVEEKTRSSEDSGTALIEPTEAQTGKEKMTPEAKSQTVLVQPQMEIDTEPNVKSEGENGDTTGDGAKAAAEKKAAKIERLKSGFRICKPQGTFLWPNNNNVGSSSQVMVQVEVPTPPSVSSSTASMLPQLPLLHHPRPPASPVRPMPERRAITVTVSSVGNSSNFSTTTTTTTGSSNKTTTWINLNDMPNTTYGEGLCGTPSSRQQNVPPMKTEARKSTIGSSSQNGVGTWLALAAPTNANEGPTRG